MQKWVKALRVVNEGREICQIRGMAVSVVVRAVTLVTRSGCKFVHAVVGAFRAAVNNR